MSLKKFLQKQGFIEIEPENRDNLEHAASQAPSQTIPPTYFPIHESDENEAAVTSSTSSASVDSFVQQPKQQTRIDESFIKFFEEELLKANLPGPDYFEFRRQLITMYQKMASKSGASPEVILQAVLTSFESQNIPASKLIEAAQHYKDVIKQKKETFLSGAGAEKNNQLQKRTNVLQTHQDSIKRMQEKLRELELQKQQIEEALKKEQTQMEVDKTLGKEGIEKIEKAEVQISLAHDFMIQSIDSDIRRLQSVS